MIVLYPQTTVDNATNPTWSGNLSNAMACFDWIGQYGDSDQKGGVQMEAMVNMVRRIIGSDENTRVSCSEGAFHPSLRFN